MSKGLLIITVALFPITVHAQQLVDSAVRTTVCDLLRQPDKYNRKLVEIDAHIAWSEEGSVIFDKNCTGLILFGVSPQMDTLPGPGETVPRTHAPAEEDQCCREGLGYVRTLGGAGLGTYGDVRLTHAHHFGF